MEINICVSNILRFTYSPLHATALLAGAVCTVSLKVGTVSNNNVNPPYHTALLGLPLIPILGGKWVRKKDYSWLFYFNRNVTKHIQ